MRQTENIKNEFKTRLANFIAYEAQLINNSSNHGIEAPRTDAVIELNGCRYATGVKLQASGNIQIMHGTTASSPGTLAIDELLEVSSAIETKFLKICNIQ